LTFLFRGPVIHHDPVREIHDGETVRRFGRRRRGKGRNHGIKERQGQSCTDAFEQSAARNRLLSDDHHDSRVLLIWNGVLLTIPMTRSDQRYLRGSASFW